MLRTLVVVACLLTAVPAQATSRQTASDLAQREAAVRAVFTPHFKEGMREPIERSWRFFPAEDVHPEELAAGQAAFTRESEVTLDLFSTRATQIVARHVPLDQLQSNSTTVTPEWQAAMAEIETLVEAEATVAGVELAVRVIEIACKARRDPSVACISLLTTAADYRSGRLSLPDAAPR